MSAQHRPIGDQELKEVFDHLVAALDEADPEARHVRVGSAVRAMTRIWSQANPEFDGDAWYAISALLSQHWNAIRQHMADNER